MPVGIIHVELWGIFFRTFYSIATWKESPLLCWFKCGILSSSLFSTFNRPTRIKVMHALLFFWSVFVSARLVQNLVRLKKDLHPLFWLRAALNPLSADQQKTLATGGSSPAEKKNEGRTKLLICFTFSNMQTEFAAHLVKGLGQGILTAQWASIWRFAGQKMWRCPG